MMQEIIREGLKRGKVKKLSGDFEYYRFMDPLKGIERGTVITKKKIVWGFPHIKRIFTLERGIERNIHDSIIYVEEKVDGFNIRIAKMEKGIYAFSRGGFLEAFVTEKVRDMKLGRFFKDNPNYVLCAEMIGNTPYTDPTNEFDVKMFVFDIDRGDGSYLPPKEKYSILKKYGIEYTPKLGKFSSNDYEGLKKLVLTLNRGRKEGLVIKSSDRKDVVKYVTPFADIDDIAKTSNMLFDMPIGFFYQRILRSAIFIDEFGFDKDKYSTKLGKAFYSGLEKAIKNVSAGREIDEEFEILIKDIKIWEDIRKNMSKGVGLEKLWERNEKGKTRIRFRKIYRRTTKKLSSYVQGKGITD
jgi:putative ATP-dependent DNA ligase